MADFNEVDADVLQDFLIWLSFHEQDIADGVEDFGELQELFFQLSGRNAGEDHPDTDTPMW